MAIIKRTELSKNLTVTIFGQHNRYMKSRVRSSSVVIHNGKLLCFLAIDPHDQREFYFLPGGEIEADETAPESAVRETFEETGYQIRVEEETSIDQEYEFLWNGEMYNSLTIFYRGYLTNPLASPKKVNDASYHKGVIWLPVEEIKNKFSYQKEILDAILELIKD